MGIAISGLYKSFTRGGQTLPVLQDINLNIADGEFVSIVGASGCGKTTLLRIMDGLIKSDAGEVRLGDRVVTEPGPDRGFVFQMGALFPWLDAMRNTTYGLEIQRRPKPVRQQVAQRILRLVGLSLFTNRYPHELSGGMQQRVNIARAMAIDPQVLLMDEPFAALDAQTREMMQYELMRIWATSRKTAVFVTHQIDEAVFLSDRVVVLTTRPGRVKEIVPIDLPRPRDLHMKRSPAFTALVDRIWTLIEHEVRESMETEAQAGVV